MKEYILCSAIVRLKPRKCHNDYYVNDILFIEIGYRHCDILHRFEGEVSKNNKDQGFYTSKGRYVTRQEAYKIAFDNNQIIGPNKGIPKNSIGLTSEDLY